MKSNGMGIEFGILLNDEVIRFKLGCIVENTVWKKDKLVYAFLEVTDLPEKRFIKGSLYSGGETGFGVSFYEVDRVEFITPERVRRVLTDDPMKAIEIMEEQERKAEERTKTENDRLARAAARINEELPLEFGLGMEDEKMRIVILRSKAGFNSLRYGGVKYYLSVEHINKENGREFGISPENYRTKDGRIRRKKIFEDLSYFGVLTVEEAIDRLTKMRIALKDIKDKINGIIRNTK